MDIYYKNQTFKLLKGITILFINYIIDYYCKHINKQTFIDKFNDCFYDLIKTFKFSIKIGIFYTVIWYICCFLLFKNKNILSQFLEKNSPIFIRRFIIIEIL